jgi:hypothetical protein
LVAQLRQAGAAEGGKAWAAVESYACTGQPGIRQTEQQYKEYLGGLLAHGAKVVNVYGWNLDNSDSPYAASRSVAVPAVKKWLAGERLPSTWFRSEKDSRQVAAIHAKMAKVQEMAHDLVGRGCDPHLVKAILDSLQSECEPLAKVGKLAEVDSALDRAMARLQALP